MYPMMVDSTATTTPSLMLFISAVPIFVFSRTYLIEERSKLPSVSVIQVISNLITGYIQKIMSIRSIAMIISRRPGCCSNIFSSHLFCNRIEFIISDTEHLLQF